MNIETMDKKIKKRAAEITSKDIVTFKTAVDKALDVLCHGTWDARKQCLAVMASADNTKGWPKILWEAREKLVRDDVFSTMDAVQKMLLSKGGGDEFTSDAETDEGTETNG